MGASMVGLGLVKVVCLQSATLLGLGSTGSVFFMILRDFMSSIS